MTPHQIRESTAAGVLAFALALSGCGSESHGAASATPTGTPERTATPQAPAAFPAGLRGSWKRTMTARDWKPVGSGYPLGTWRLDVDRKGDASVYLPRTDAVDFTTQFAVKGQQLTIESIPVCPGQTGRYTWRASARAMTLTVVDAGGCEQGAALFGGTWTRRH